jgi:insulysin
MRIVIQSERGPKYLEKRVEAFLDTMKGMIEEMSDELFEEQKAGLEKKWRENAKNMGDEAKRHWRHIDTGHLDFLRREHLDILC